MLQKPLCKTDNTAAHGPLTADAPTTERLREEFFDSGDIVFTEVKFGDELTCTLAFLDGMVHAPTLNRYILKPAQQDEALRRAASADELRSLIEHGRIYHARRVAVRTVSEALRELLFGSAVLIPPDGGNAVAFEAKGFDKRAISEPTNENVLKGSKEGFVEVLRVNTALVRRRIQSARLQIASLTLGRRTNTGIAVVYLAGVANAETVRRVKQRLQRAEFDGITGAGQIEALLQERRATIFPQMLYTERPDKFVGNILEGRIGVIIDGLPIAYIVPVDFNAFMQATEDYAQHFVLSSIFRLLRYACALSSLILPAFYVSVTTFHPEMIPTKLAISIIASKQGVPFATYMEVILMLLAFEVLLEAGVRLPQAIGQAVSIVGALVVGQAAITANMLSPGVVIVIAASGITGFVVPSQDMANVIRMLRIALVFLATIGGLFATTLGLIAILYHMCTLEAFGTPYLSPFAGGDGRNTLADTILRRSLLKNRQRPANILPEDSVRVSVRDE